MLKNFSRTLVCMLLGLVMNCNYAFAGVMMQGFYWNVPNDGTWWNTMKSKASELSNMSGGYGINRMWFPPAYKGQSGVNSMGYDPHDYYDLGSYSQDGTTNTRFGSQANLKAAIAAYKANGISCMEDIVLNHRSGGKSEWNPYANANTYTDFSNTASGKAQWHYESFHPNPTEQSDEGTFSGMPDVCYSSGSAYNDIKTWMNWLKNPDNAGFDSWRFDYVKGFHSSVVKDMSAATNSSFSIGEYWDGNTSNLESWTSAANASAFDFPLYYTLRDICNDTSGNQWLPNVFNESKSYAAKNPMKAVTFAANHDTDEIATDKMMAYAFILTYQGYPCIFWKDYYNYGLSTGGGAGTAGSGNGIKQLVWAREKLANGSPNIEILQSNNGQCIIYGSKGSSSSSPGYIVVINSNPSNWAGYSVQTSNSYLKGKNLKAYAWSSTVSGQNYCPNNRYCDNNGNVTLYAPPRGYAVYAPDGL